MRRVEGRGGDRKGRKEMREKIRKNKRKTIQVTARTVSGAWRIWQVVR